MDATTIFNYAVTSLMRGSNYSLMAMGLALVFGVMNIANFAHGEMYMIGAYISFFVFHTLGLHPLIAILLAAIGAFIFGCLLEKGLFVPLRLKSKKGWLMNTFMLTAGISIIIQNCVSLFFGNQNKGISSFYKGSVKVGSMNIPYDRVVAFLIAVSCIVGLMLFLKYSRLGCAIRAVAQDDTGSELVGIPLNFIYTFTLGLSCALAAIAGAALLPINPANPSMSIAPLYKSWFVLILVGIGNVGGCIVGGLIVGLLETIAVAVFGTSWMDVISLGVIIVILLVKPNGIFGKKGVKSAVE